MTLVAVLLLSGPALLAVESVGYRKGRFDSAFWRLPLDEKLDRIDEYRWQWRWVSVWELVGMVTVAAGMAGLTQLLGAAGEPTLASVALGAFAISAVAWVFGLLVQGAAVPEAASQRRSSGPTPTWLQPLWDAAFLSELVYVVGTNAAFALFGFALLGTDLVASWAGWVMLVGGTLTAAVVAAARDAFPQLGYLLPSAVGVALLLEVF